MPEKFVDNNFGSRHELEALNVLFILSASKSDDLDIIIAPLHLTPIILLTPTVVTEKNRIYVKVLLQKG